MAEPVRPIARHPVFHDGELDAHRRFGVVPTWPSVGARHFIETQPFMFVGAGCGGRAAAPAGCASRGIAVSPNCASGRAVVE
ncbi:hypothetical protein BGV69_25240 [Burkholderia ubonensis]|nr:hypothetical protein [Burkholderia ubonensis]KVP44992.1 hypothetical protein WJ87_01915 [Burkholderia ubonensis]KWB85490.1 hypothetical protein WL42_32480 [Burkholderia ubonensis]OJA53841.1 hypothetical protein BGV69_25240 [Burkholderia ubonensis]